jgi:hypothetical protein
LGRAGIPGELHLLGHSFTGPGTKLDIRLDENDRPREWSKPINRVEEIAMKHGIGYRECQDDLSCKQEQDRIMLQLLDSIPDPTIRERVEKMIVKAALKTKLISVSITIVIVEWVLLSFDYFNKCRTP